MKATLYIIACSLGSILTYAILQPYFSSETIAPYILMITYGALINVICELGTNIVYIRSTVGKTNSKILSYVCLALLHKHSKKIPALFTMHGMLCIILYNTHQLTISSIFTYFIFAFSSYTFQVIITTHQIKRDFKKFEVAYRNAFIARACALTIMLFILKKHNIEIKLSQMLLINALPFLTSVLSTVSYSDVKSTISVKRQTYLISSKTKNHLTKNARLTLIVLPISKLDYILISNMLSSDFLAIYHLLQMLLQGVTLIINSTLQRYAIKVLEAPLFKNIKIILLANIAAWITLNIILSIIQDTLTDTDPNLLTRIIFIVYENSSTTSALIACLSLNSLLALYMNKTYQTDTVIIAAFIQTMTYLILLLVLKPFTVEQLMKIFICSQIIATCIYSVSLRLSTRAQRFKWLQIK